MTSPTSHSCLGSELSADEIKAEELRMLVAFRSFCRAEGLSYSLCGGTLLGAVRHQGFIPWDDDIDVCMPRPDYEKLIGMGASIGNRCGLDLVGYFGLDPEISPFSKLCSRDIFVQAAVEAKRSRLWIDIFPVDSLPDDARETARLYQRAAIARAPLMVQHAAPSAGSTVLKRIAKAAARPLLCQLHADRHCARRLKAIASERPWASTSHVGVLTWGLYGPGERVPLDGFCHQTEMEFEGELFTSMACWNEYLAGIYGNYMELPPENKRVSHGLRAWRVESAEKRDGAQK